MRLAVRRARSDRFAAVQFWRTGMACILALGLAVVGLCCEDPGPRTAENDSRATEQAHLGTDEAFYAALDEDPQGISWEDWKGAVRAGVRSALELYRDDRLPGTPQRRLEHLAAYLEPPSTRHALAAAAAIAGNRKTRDIVEHRNALAEVALAHAGEDYSFMVAFGLHHALGLEDTAGIPGLELFAPDRGPSVVRQVARATLALRDKDLTGFVVVDDALDAMKSSKPDAINTLLDSCKTLEARARQRLRYHARSDWYLFGVVAKRCPALITPEVFRDAIRRVHPDYAGGLLLHYPYEELLDSDQAKQIEEVLLELIKAPETSVVKIAAIASQVEPRFVRQHAEAMAQAGLRAVDEQQLNAGAEIARTLFWELPLGDEYEAVTDSFDRADGDASKRAADRIREVCLHVIERGGPWPEDE